MKIMAEFRKKTVDKLTKESVKSAWMVGCGARREEVKTPIVTISRIVVSRFI